MLPFPTHGSPALKVAALFANGMLVVGGVACLAVIGSVGIGALVVLGAATGVYR